MAACTSSHAVAPTTVTTSSTTTSSVSKGAGGAAAQANLVTALIGAKTYYVDADQSYVGLLSGVGAHGESTSTLSELGTPLSFVSGTAATGGRTLSVRTGADGTWFEAAAWAPGVADCWLVLDNTSDANTGTIEGFALRTSGGTTGTYFGVARTLRNSTTCQPGLRPTATSTVGFPSS
jgi:hypothetical protein